MQQNGLTCKKLVDKLIETKNNSKTNQARNKATSSFISANFFSKFLKAKVDKSRALDDVLALLGGALQTGGKLDGGVLRSLLDVLVAKGVAGKGHGSVEQTWE